MSFATRSIPRPVEALIVEKQALGAEIIGPQRGPQERFLACQAKIIGYGGSAGSGKTMSQLLKALRYAALQPKPGYNAVIFRRVMPQVTLPGGLWDESQNIYRLTGGKANQSRYEWRWPQYGTKIKFAAMQYEADRHAWQGSQLAYIGFEELCHFSSEQFFYLLSRARSTCGVIPQICATMNPDADSWVKGFFAPWVDEHYDGPGGPAKSGEIRWFIRDGGVIHWLLPGEQHPDAVSVSFIAASIWDNPALLSADPSYLASLKALPLVERQRLLYGDWSARNTGALFKRHWFPLLDQAPPPSDIERIVRYWDLAATEVSAENPDPDWTCGVKVARLKDDSYVVLDMRRERYSSAKVEELIRRTAEQDGHECAVFMEQEPGSSGKNVIDYYRRKVLAGFAFSGIKSTGDKATRATPVASQAEGRNIAMLRGYWNDALLSELEAFPTPGVHDDSCILPGSHLPYIAHDNKIDEYQNHHVEVKAMLIGEAQHLKEGNLVQTHTGEWQRITQIMTRQYAGDVISIKPQGGFVLTLTPEHPVLCIQRKSKWQKRVSGTPKWINASNVRVGDAVLEAIDQRAVPIETIDLAEWLLPDRFERQGKRSNAGLYISKLIVEPDVIRFNNPKSHPIKRFVPVNGDLCRLMGYYVAEGYRGKHNIAWAFHRNETEYHEDVRQIVDKLFGTSTSLHLSKGDQSAHVYASSLILHDFFAQFGSGALSKVVPQWILHLPTDMQVEFLKGAWRGDGCVAKKSYDKLIYVSASRSLIVGLRMILYRLGIVPSIGVSRPNGKEGHAINGKTVKYSSPLYELCVSGDYSVKLAPMIDEVLTNPSKDNANDRISNGYVQRAVRRVELSNYEGSVYNFEVEHDHSYQTESFIVHNCDALSGAMEQLFSKSATGHIDWSKRLLEMRQNRH